jgi:hypothetical protein
VAKSWRNPRPAGVHAVAILGSEGVLRKLNTADLSIFVPGPAVKKSGDYRV